VKGSRIEMTVQEIGAPFGEGRRIMDALHSTAAPAP
jgi:hypothetical protein